MTPKFAEAVDPIFEYILTLLDRIDQRQSPSPEQTQSFIRNVLLNRAEQKLGQSHEWQMAKYALVCWIDEMLVNSRWDGQGWWMNNVLEFAMFQSSDRALRFYVSAKEAVGTATGDAMEVYYLAVILGFRGVYENPEQSAIDIAANDLPPTLEEWLRRTGEGIRLSATMPIQSTGRLPQGAPPLGGYSFLTSSLVLFTVAAAIFCVVLIIRGSFS